MAPLKTDFPPVRACIFDMDGLLINSEDIITLCTNEVLGRYGRPAFTRSMRAQLMGVPDSTNSDTFHNWAKIPVSREQFTRELKEQMRLSFPDCEPLPGAETILSNLSCARAESGAKIELALASSTKTPTYKLKTSKPRSQKLLSFFQANRQVLGDDPRVQQGRGKPAPDIYLAALQSINTSIDSTTPAKNSIMPDECLVFEDSIAGVEAGRRAGMRVVWIPHPDLAVEYQPIHKDVLAGRTGRFEIGEDWQLGEIDDGWAESISSLEHFNYEKYGIQITS
ncbi:HAD-like domain-containing protein [Xylaria telfairii]|nr:HAD-like domain-containing protein [Xylaria telfairii]